MQSEMCSTQTHPRVSKDQECSEQKGPPLELVEKLRKAIQKEFTLEPVMMPKPSFGLPRNIRADILYGVMRAAGDLDTNTLHKVHRWGWPDTEDLSPTRDVSHWRA